jgi:hypothetical protein
MGIHFLFIILIVVVILIVFYSGKGVPVLLYHQVYPSGSTTPAVLEQHFQYIAKKRFHTFTCTETLTRKKLPARALLITFDDGYYDNFLYVFPLLKKYNLKATFFINTAYIPEHAFDRERLILLNDVAVNNAAVQKMYKTGNGQSQYYMSWEEIKIMYESGLCDFQAHSHRHKCVFSSTELKDIVQRKEFDTNQLHCYDGSPVIGYPMFKSRGELSVRKMEIQNHFIQLFLKEYQTSFQFLPKKKMLKTAAEFIRKNSSSETFQLETKEAFEERVRKELKQNISEIESHLGNKVKFLAWPWGHHTNEGRVACEKVGIEGFLTCRKKTNDQILPMKRINRTEIRKPSLLKLKFLLLIQSNYFTGKLVGLFT